MLVLGLFLALTIALSPALVNLSSLDILNLLTREVRFLIATRGQRSIVTTVQRTRRGSGANPPSHRSTRSEPRSSRPITTIARSGYHHNTVPSEASTTNPSSARSPFKEGPTFRTTRLRPIENDEVWTGEIEVPWIHAQELGHDGGGVVMRPREWFGLVMTAYPIPRSYVLAHHSASGRLDRATRIEGAVARPSGCDHHTCSNARQGKASRGVVSFYVR